MSRMSSEPLVSVVMTVLEPHPRLFREAVGSVFAQTYANWELVIVEDPSAAAAADMLRDYSDPRIRHFCNSQRTSHSRQRNQSLELSRGDLIATLDADDRCHPLRLARQVAFLQAHPEIAVVGSQLSMIDAHGRPCGSRQYPRTPDGIRRAFPQFNPIAQPSVMFRKEVILAAGGYQYDLFPAVEDYELWSRLAAAGVQFANLDDALLEYRLHPGGMKATRLKGILRGTLDVKRRYWRHALGWRGHLRMLLERLLLLAPPAATYQLFRWLVLRRAAAPQPAL